ncbi:uncharacterized protein [Triticum aestivum]|uniref:uncharacterized protein isoform X1 n=1 Tax=Triticum aestivum TaxID=4565 RepID=UPI001D009535|nr:uncharacterized protein LOC123137259 isoform X1 [Triticum aestivum]
MPETSWEARRFRSMWISTITLPPTFSFPQLCIQVPNPADQYRSPALYCGHRVVSTLGNKFWVCWSILISSSLFSHLVIFTPLRRLPPIVEGDGLARPSTPIDNFRQAPSHSSSPYSDAFMAKIINRSKKLGRAEMNIRPPGSKPSRW